MISIRIRQRFHTLPVQPTRYRVVVLTSGHVDVRLFEAKPRVAYSVLTDG
jgi:hypothetical protein